MGWYGHSKDHRPDRLQRVVLDQEGNPVCSELWPGNAAAVKSLVPIVARLKTRFPVGEVCIVADRGMISTRTLQQIQEWKWKYILGVRRRRSQEAREEVRGRAGRYQEVSPRHADPQAPSPLKVQEGWVADRRYLVGQNEDQAQQDRQNRGVRV